VSGADAERRARVDTAIGTLDCRVQANVKDGETVAVTVRPENVTLADGKRRGEAVNTIAGTVETIVFLGNMLDCTVAVGGERLHIQLHPATSLDRGARVQLHLPAEHCLAMHR
jgi:iron(III) transport system ATP-binding protein